VFVSEANPYRKLGRPEKPSETAILRVCAVHGEERHYALSDRGVVRYRCRRCVGEAVTRRHRKLKRTLVDEAGGCCAVCGYDRLLGNLHFHHVVPSEKSFEIQMGSGKSLAAYREEALKCVLVCANCHGEIEAGLIPSPPPGSTLHM
jgi:5-methylcytosine-specific restriction endonuclease McrA